MKDYDIYFANREEPSARFESNDLLHISLIPMKEKTYIVGINSDNGDSRLILGVFNEEDLDDAIKKANEIIENIER